ncbi:MAG: glucose-1-phosphate adenylyltransferase [Thermoguttaceae bacterium]|nr:glucose-1-phosphate adenylyltransferase [Thermoguttaceae bacterium]
MNDKILAVVLAGGKGERLGPLTRDRAKPAVPFGGAYRIVDFTLSNCLNSMIRHILLLTQYKAFSLSRHVSLGWSRFFCRERGEFLDVLPPQQRIDDSWYRGTADAVYQNIYTIEREKPTHVVVLAGDHIYKMDYRRLLDFHRNHQAELTVSALPLPVETAQKRFGVMETASDHRIIGFEEKPEHPKEIPDRPGWCLGSMGIYVFSADFLFEELCQDATDFHSRHDFGMDVIPRVIQSKRVFAYPFSRDELGDSPGIPYWKDVGTIDAYYETNMDLIRVEPELNIYDKDWPIYTHQPHDPPPKFVFSEENRKGTALESMVCGGSIVSGGMIRHSILGHRVRVNSFASVEDSILFSDVNVGRNAQIHRAIVEKGVSIPNDSRIGFDREADEAHGYFVTDCGLTIVTE